MARILVITPYEPPADGIAKHSSHLVGAWDAAGHDVLVASPGRQAGLEGCEIIGARSRVARILRKMPRPRTWHDLNGFAPDMVFVQFAVAAMSVNLWSVLNLCKRFSKAQVTVVVGFHEAAREYNLLGFATRLAYRSIARSTDIPIAFSSEGRRALIERGLFSEVLEVPHGTTGLANVTAEDIERVTRLYSLRQPLVLTMGFTSADKGTDVLLCAASDIAAGPRTEIQFLIAGSPRERRGVFRLMGYRDVRFQQQLEREAKKIVSVEVVFTGFVANEDVAPLLFVADLVAMPYRRITQSGIANLALSSKAVIVSSDLPGLRSDLGDAARYVEAGNPRALAKQIVELLADDASSIRRHLRELSGERAVASTYAKVAQMIVSSGLAKDRPELDNEV